MTAKPPVRAPHEAVHAARSASPSMSPTGGAGAAGGAAAAGSSAAAPHAAPRTAPARFRRVTKDSETANEVSSTILSMIASGTATNRADIARALGLAPSTVTIKVTELLAAGLIADTGNGDATGGRRPRVLQLVADAGYILAADLGRNHARLAVLNLSGALVTTGEIEIDITAGPEKVLTTVSAALRRLLGPIDEHTVHAVGVSLPGPVDTVSGSVDSPAAMPGWHRVSVTEWLAAEFDVVAVADNDANMMALGEYTLRTNREATGKSKQQSLLFLKAGTAVGSGMILNGHVYRGATALAGDIAHVRVSAAQELPCACGNRGCLETVAGGAGIVAELRKIGIEANETIDIVALVHEANAQATTRVRSAGRLLGETMSAVVNFINPDVVVLGGVLSTIEPFVAAIRSQLYEGCHPLATKNLRIEQSIAGADAGVLGVGQLCLRRLLSVV